MELTKHEITFDTDQLRSEVAALAETLGEQAERAAERAAQWVAPAVERARTGADRLAKETAGAAKEVQERLEVLSEDALARAERAASAARTAIDAPGTVTQRAQRATVAAVNAAQTTAPRKSRRVLKSLCWLTVAGVAAGAAYVVWRRSQPVEDPWAEEYWADSVEDDDEAVAEA